MSQKQLIYDMLTKMGIPFQITDHPAIFTMKESQALAYPQNSKVPKNLFLRDAKGKQHFLVVVDAEKTVKLSQLEQIVGCKRISFASERRLEQFLGLMKGAVSPFGLVNDQENHVELYIDKALGQAQFIGVHPNDNTATVFITPNDLLKFVRAIGHKVNQIDI